MKIITVGNTKGGVGKSTLAVNLAVASALDNQKVMIVDADVQASSMGFRSLREENNIQATAITTPTLHKDLGMFESFDWIIIDAGGRDSAVFRSAIMACDLMLIPVLPSVYDIWAGGETIEMVREAQVYKEFEARMMLNQVMGRTIMAKEALEAMDDFKADAPLLETQIHARTVFKNSILKGQGVMEYEPKSKASIEIQSLYQELSSLLRQ